MDRVLNHSLLSVQDLTVYFQSEDVVSKAVDGVSFYIDKGETVCLVGESGCGKSVSALSILGLIPCPPGKIKKGKIFFFQDNLLTLSEKELQKIRGGRIGMVFQDPLTSLNPVFTIQDQLSEMILAHKKDSPGAIKDRCMELLEQVGIPSPKESLNNYPHQLSGGQRQRVMIAMAMACNPDLLIVDEPTTALDVTIQTQIINLFRSIQEKSSTSLLYITHDLGIVSCIADRIYVMYAGFILEQGRVEQIFDQPSHPYTQGLLASRPSFQKRGDYLPHIPGTVPDPANKPTGCPFHPRCSLVQESCLLHLPDFIDCGSEHKSRCPILNR